MSVKPDHWIRKMAREHKMIEPFEDRQVRDGVISYGGLQLRLRYPRRRRIPDLYQCEFHDCRSQTLRSEVARRVQGRRVYWFRQTHSRWGARWNISAFRAMF